MVALQYQDLPCHSNKWRLKLFALMNRPNNKCAKDNASCIKQTFAYLLECDAWKMENPVPSLLTP